METEEWTCGYGEEWERTCGITRKNGYRKVELHRSKAMGTEGWNYKEERGQKWHYQNAEGTVELKGRMGKKGGITKNCNYRHLHRQKCKVYGLKCHKI